jgi:O-acetylhomoserine/O-acetylserine sulfhydrylase-like pyridoxal-dependent enzyme
VERVIILFRVEPFTAEPMLSWKLYTKNGHQNHFVDITKLDVEAAITADTKVLYCETVSNPY